MSPRSRPDVKESKMLKTNVGMIDRVVRVIAGILLLAAFFYFPDTPWRYALLVGFVPLLTGLFASCPAYSVLGLSTCPAKKT